MSFVVDQELLVRYDRQVEAAWGAGQLNGEGRGLVDPKQSSDTRWEFYKTSAGASVVSQEIRQVLGGKPPSIELSRLMWRIQTGNVFPRDVRPLGEGLFEARLTYASNEYRLYFARHPVGTTVLLGLKFHQKGSRGAQEHGIAVARKRLADWLSRI